MGSPAQKMRGLRTILSFWFEGVKQRGPILLPMQRDIGNEWERLTRLYAEKCDEELSELAAGFADLTEIAQQVLRDELRKRGLREPQASDGKEADEKQRRFGRWREAFAADDREFVADAHALEDGSSEDEQGEEGEVEYTWKTLLCTCDESEQAWQIREVLQRAGIESWIEAPNANALDVMGPRVLVAADQLKEARAIAERPIPQEIIDQSRVKVEDFVPPSCPKCGAMDPLLESVEPTNTWLCEVCNAEWSEAGVSLPKSSPFLRQ